MGGSTLFNGATSGIDCGSEIIGAGAVTVSVWIKAKSFGEGTFGRILENGKFKLNINTGDAPGKCFQFSSAGITNASSIGGSAVLNRWTHILITRAASGIANIYINGILSGTANQNSGTPEAGTTNLFIGNRSANDRTFDGYIAEACIVKRIVTEAERYAIMNGSFPSDTTNLWKLDDQPSAYVDHIGGANGTGTNTTYSQDVPVQQRMLADEAATASLLFDGNGDFVTLIQTVIPGTVAFEYKMRNYLDKTFFHCASPDNTIQTYVDGRWEVYDGSDRVSNLRAILNVWIKMAFVYNGIGYDIYENGKYVSSIAASQQIIIERISRNTTGAINGYLKNVRMWSQATQLTRKQIRDLHLDNIIPTDGLVGEWKLNEGAGTVAYDTSGNGNHGTITGAVWSSDVPSKKRKVIGGNLVKNGDISYIPVVNVAQTTNARWIDGTATGSTNNDYANLFGFFATNRRGTATYTVNFDTEVTYRGKPSIKIEVTAQSGCEVSVRKTSNVLTGWSASAIGYIPIKPSTQYIARIAIKTVGVPDGGANTNVNVSVAQIGANKTSYITQAVPINNLFGTQDFTEYELTFTSNVNARFADFIFEIRDTTGVAYFSDIQLVEVGAARLPVT